MSIYATIWSLKFPRRFSDPAAEIGPERALNLVS